MAVQGRMPAHSQPALSAQKEPKLTHLPLHVKQARRVITPSQESRRHIVESAETTQLRTPLQEQDEVISAYHRTPGSGPGRLHTLAMG